VLPYLTIAELSFEIAGNTNNGVSWASPLDWLFVMTCQSGLHSKQESNTPTKGIKQKNMIYFTEPLTPMSLYAQSFGIPINT
jgi:hypothetical protein